jgi:Domain of unknown function (DUF1707)
MTSSTGRFIRASDHDRGNAAELLMEAYAAGRLSREEFDERATAAYSARTLGELLDLTADLPFRQRDPVSPPISLLSGACPGATPNV